MDLCNPLNPHVDWEVQKDKWKTQFQSSHIITLLTKWNWLCFAYVYGGKHKFYFTLDAAWDFYTKRTLHIFAKSLLILSFFFPQLQCKSIFMLLQSTSCQLLSHGFFTAATKWRINIADGTNWRDIFTAFSVIFIVIPQTDFYVD